MSRRGWDINRLSASSSCKRKRTDIGKILCMGMGRKKNKKKVSSVGRNHTKKRNRRTQVRSNDSSDDELPPQSSRRSPRSSSRILQSGRSFESVQSDDLSSFRNLEQSLQVTDHLHQDQPNSIYNSNVNSRKKNSFTSSFIFHNLLNKTNSIEAEESPSEWRIFQPNFPLGEPSEDQHILREMRNIFEDESKLKDSIIPSVDRENPSHLDNQKCHDWDNFLERWEGMHIPSSDHELRTREEPVCATKRKKRISSPSFNGQTKKRSRTAAGPEFVCESSFLEEHSSKRNSFLPSFEKEMEMVVHPVSSTISEANTASKLEKFIKNTKIKLLKNNEMPPFTKKCIALDPMDLPNGSFLSNLCKNQIYVEENLSGGTNKSEELTAVEEMEDKS